MDSAVTAQLGFGGHSDPVTLSTEFKKYGWQVTGSPKSSRGGLAADEVFAVAGGQ